MQINKNNILTTIKNYQPITMEVTPVAAAVLVLLMENEQGNLFLILTKRGEKLVTYAGDYSFPGGMRELTDVDLQMTAQREVIEELNLAANSYEVIGQLDDFLDRYGNMVRPYVATITQAEFEARDKKFSDEVAKIYYFPLSQVLNIETDKNLEITTRRHPTYIYRHDDVIVWGLTASIIVHLSNIIFAVNKPLGKGLIEK